MALGESLIMGLFDLFRNRKNSHSANVIKDKYTLATLLDLDIDNAIAAHENWNLRLLAYVRGISNEVWDPAEVCSDKNCELGKWIYSQGYQYFSGEPAFASLVRYHSQFHFHASNIVTLHQLGEIERAERELRGRYADLSWRVVNALREIKTSLLRF